MFLSVPECSLSRVSDMLGDAEPTPEASPRLRSDCLCLCVLSPAATAGSDTGPLGVVVGAVFAGGQRQYTAPLAL